MHKVLLIDDKRPFHWLWTWGIRDHFEFLHAYSIQQGLELFQAHDGISAIVVDACVDHWWLDTCELIGQLSEDFNGPLIAAPCQWWHFEPMKRAGCTEHVWKWQVSKRLCELFP